MSNYPTETPGQRLIVASLHRWSENVSARGVAQSAQIPVVKGFSKVYADLRASSRDDARDSAQVRL